MDGSFGGNIALECMFLTFIARLNVFVSKLMEVFIEQRKQ